MMEADPNEVAGRVLRRLKAYYGRDGLEEVVINRPGRVWIKRRGGAWEDIETPEIDYKYLARVCKVLANINNAQFSEAEIPIVACELPGDPFRFQAVMGPNVRYETSDRRGVAIAIRALTANTAIGFENYGLVSGVDLPGRAETIVSEFGLSMDHVKAISRIVERHESIIVSGATSTGKTTFTNKIIELIPREARVITVEDARELSVPHRNRVHLMVPRSKGSNAIGYAEIIDALVRLTPDWIICGELSVANAQPIYATMGKGHPIVTTVHAGTPEEAVAAFANNMSIAGGSVSNDPDALAQSIRAQIGMVIQLERRDGKRRVVEIDYPSSRVRESA
mgnify:CR=1 FL=1